MRDRDVTGLGDAGSAFYLEQCTASMQQLTDHPQATGLLLHRAAFASKPSRLQSLLAPAL